MDQVIETARSRLQQSMDESDVQHSSFKEFDFCRKPNFLLEMRNKTSISFNKDRE